MKEKIIEKKTIFLISVVAAILVLVGSVMLTFAFKSNDKDVYRSIKIVESDGNVNIEREGKNDIQASANMNLQSGDRISTEKDSYAVLCLDNDKFVRLNSESTISVNAVGSEENGKTKIVLEEGGVLNEIQNPLKDGSTYEVETPNATMSVRGTVYEVRLEKIDEEDCTSVLVYDGRVEVAVDGMEPAIYGEGEYTQFTNSENPRFIVERAGITKDVIDRKMMKWLEEISDSGRETFLDKLTDDAVSKEAQESSSNNSESNNSPANTIVPGSSSNNTDAPAIDNKKPQSKKKSSKNTDKPAASEKHNDDNKPDTVETGNPTVEANANELMTPGASFELRATDSPKVTDKVDVTKKPKETVGPPIKPDKTEEPKATYKPNKTEKPNVTKVPPTVKPDKTEEPKVTKEPSKTEEPKVTKEPDRTEEPKATKEPDKTEEPKVTKEPDKTEEPKVTKEPSKTEEPKESKEPGATETKEPQSTEPSEFTPKPQETEPQGKQYSVTFYIPYIAECYYMNVGDAHPHASIKDIKPEVYKTIKAVENNKIDEPEEPKCSDGNLKFVAWYSEETREEFDFSTKIDSDIKLYPVWENENGEKYYPIIYRSSETNLELCNSAKEGCIGYETSTRFGYNLLGWEKPDGSLWGCYTEKIDGFETLNAVWELKFSLYKRVVFKTSIGDIVDVERVMLGQKASGPKRPLSDGIDLPLDVVDKAIIDWQKDGVSYKDKTIYDDTDFISVWENEK